MKTEDRIELYCDVSDIILLKHFYPDGVGMDFEDEDGNHYTEEAQDKFNEISDQVEGIILSITDGNYSWDNIVQQWEKNNGY